MRLFFALWPSPAAANALAQWARDVQRETGGRATSAQTIHLTLAFLGEADPDGAIAAARRVRSESFGLPVDDAKYWRHNRIVWVGPHAMPDPLRQLAADLRRELLLEKFAMEERAFAAHVTLIRKAGAPKSLPPLPHLDWPAPEFVLVRAAPAPAGSRYEVIERFPMI